MGTRRHRRRVCMYMFNDIPTNRGVARPAHCNYRYSRFLGWTVVWDDESVHLLHHSYMLYHLCSTWNVHTNPSTQCVAHNISFHFHLMAGIFMRKNAFLVFLTNYGCLWKWRNNLNIFIDKLFDVFECSEALVSKSMSNNRCEKMSVRRSLVRRVGSSHFKDEANF